MLKTPVFKMFLPISPLRRFAPAPPSVGEPGMVQQPYKLKSEFPQEFPQLSTVNCRLRFIPPSPLYNPVLFL